MALDHRRIFATALGHLRGKLAYTPVVFELLAGEFGLLQLQQVVGALSVAKLHEQNFRRTVINVYLVEPIGRTSAVGRASLLNYSRFVARLRARNSRLACLDLLRRAVTLRRLIKCNELQVDTF